MALFSDLLWLVYLKIDGQLKSIKQIELASDSTTGIEEVYKCPSESPNYCHLRNFFLPISIYLATSFVETRTFLSR